MINENVVMALRSFIKEFIETGFINQDLLILIENLYFKFYLNMEDSFVATCINILYGHNEKLNADSCDYVCRMLHDELVTSYKMEPVI